MRDKPPFDIPAPDELARGLRAIAATGRTAAAAATTAAAAVTTAAQAMRLVRAEIAERYDSPRFVPKAE